MLTFVWAVQMRLCENESESECNLMYAGAECSRCDPLTVTLSISSSTGTALTAM